MVAAIQLELQRITIAMHPLSGKNTNGAAWFDVTIPLYFSFHLFGF